MPKIPLLISPISLFVFLLSLIVFNGAVANAQEATDEISRASLVSPQLLEARIDAAENGDLSEEESAKLLTLLRSAQSNLQKINRNAELAESFRDANVSAPEQTRITREKIEQEKDADPLVTLAALEVDLDMPLRELDRYLQDERAALAASKARTENFSRRLLDEESRPTVIRQRLLELSQQQEEAAAQLRVPMDPAEDQSLNEARRWVLQTEVAALAAEIKALNEELNSQGVRRDLLEAQSEQEDIRLTQIETRLEALSTLVNRRRQQEAAEANETAEQVRKDTIGSDPLLIELAERNAELTNDLNETAARLDELDKANLLAEKLTTRIDADSTDAREAVEGSGRSEGLGEVLVAHRSSLPDARQYRDRSRARKREIDAVVVRNLRHREELRRLGDVDQVLERYNARLTNPGSQELEEQLRELLEHRSELLDKALADDELYLNRLRELDGAERELMAEIASYKEFLDENLLWLGSVHPTRPSDFRALPKEVKQLLSPAIWSSLLDAFLTQIAKSPTAWLALLVVIGLVWRRRSAIAVLEDISLKVNRSETDSFSLTVKAFFLTLIVAAPIPLLLAIVGWQLNRIPAEIEPVYSAVGGSLMRVAGNLYILGLLSVVCMPRGLASVHFRWRKRSLRVLRPALKSLTRVYIPALIVLRLSMDINDADTGGLITRLAFVAGYGALVLFFLRILHPTRGVFSHWRLGEQSVAILIGYCSGFLLLVATPLLLSTLPLMGYLYSVLTLSLMYVSTLWAALVLVLLQALALRGLRLTTSQYALRAAVDAAEQSDSKDVAVDDDAASAAAGENDDLAVEEPELDIETISDDIHGLVNILTIVAGLAALYFIWSPLLPALRIFDSVHLWYQTAIVNGEEVRSPISLGDLFEAGFYILGIGVVMARLPALMEVILQRRFDVSAGSRYAAVVLTKYALVVFGVLLVANTIGAQWSQLQWLVAALSVGIGFGLQEIVANFISGLIILFERPVRVGDVVTVGETEGVVTKIRIRATTIRTWDRRELLVPNKELITARVLNWSLSDEVSRVMVVVGVAYGSNVEAVQALMYEAAHENDLVVSDPAPFVSFEEFGDNALTFRLRAYIQDLQFRLSTISELHKAINQKFVEAGIVIAFPQRDLHLNTTGPLQVSIDDARQSASDDKSNS
ncbi:MAG: mechanosensitive ion channel domain-containing protein [Halioglobus sp.]